MKQYKLYINGQWVDSKSGKTCQSINPYTEEPVAEVALAGPEDAADAVASARKSFDEGKWRDMNPAKREKILLEVLREITKRSSELAQTEVHDSGATIRKAMGDVAVAIQHMTFFANKGREVFQDKPLSGDGALFGYNIAIREPVGVCGCIIPWNFPLLMAIWKIGPALATGNSVVLKPAPETPCTAFELTKIIDESEIPKGVLNVVTGDAEVGEAIVTDPRVDKVAFTGSTAVGRRIMELASRQLKKLTLELGGKSPNIVLDDADLGMAVDGALFGCFFHAGQVCTSGSRLFLQEKIFDKFVETLVAKAKKIKQGDPMDFSTGMGPLVSAQHRERVEKYIELGKQEGATLLVGGKRPEHLKKGYFVEPTIFDNARNDMKIAQEEIFGPVISILRFKSEGDVAKLANDTIYGLAGAVWSKNTDRALSLARKIQTGTVWINEYHILSPFAPFGGYKQSGIGKELGEEGLLAYTQTKHVHIDLIGDRSRKIWYDMIY